MLFERVGMNLVGVSIADMTRREEMEMRGGDVLGCKCIFERVGDGEFWERKVLSLGV